MPRLPLRQMVCQILFAWDSPHFYSSRLGHILQPQIPQLHVSSLSETSSRRYHALGWSRPVCHHRQHSKSIRCTRDDCVILGFRRAQRTRRLRSGLMFHHCAVDHHHASACRFSLRPLRPIRIYLHVHVHLIVMSPRSHHPRHFLCPLSNTCLPSSAFSNCLELASPSSYRLPSRRIVHPTCPSSCSSASPPNF